jgi:two-component sensor histidine kinase
MISNRQPVTYHPRPTMTWADEAQQLGETCHDMKQPLACVFALAAAALAEPGLPPSAADRLEQLVEQARWLRDMIEQLMHGDHHPGDRVRLIDLAVLAEEIVAAERLVYDGEIGFTRPSEPVLAWGDPVDVRRIIANLLGNATRAAGSPGRVQVDVRSEQETAQLTIDDTGPGFGRIPAGHGLGLQSVARSASRCQGSIKYARGPLGGVRVRLCLPMAIGAPPAEQTRLCSHRDLGPPRARDRGHDVQDTLIDGYSPETNLARVCGRSRRTRSVPNSPITARHLSHRRHIYHFKTHVSSRDEGLD